MARVSTYLNFSRETEEAFAFYKKVFGTDYDGEIVRFRDTPAQEGQPEPSDEDNDLVMYVGLPITAGHILRGTDAPESMGFGVNKGNNVYIMLEPDTPEEADRLFSALGEGGNIEMEMADMFWGDYFGSLVDKFGVQWMISIPGSEQ